MMVTRIPLDAMILLFDQQHSLSKLSRSSPSSNADCDGVFGSSSSSSMGLLLSILLVCFGLHHILK
jgi:hypothetical protein